MLNVSENLAPAGTPNESSWPGRVSAGGRHRLVIAGLVALAFLVAYLPVLRILTQQWATNDAYSFGILVPFISAYLIWSRRGRLRALPADPSLWGIPVVLMAAAGLILGRVTAIIAFQELSLVLMLFGVVLLLLGSAFLRELWFPLTYLLLMLPVWEVVTDDLQHPSQLLSARLAEGLLQLGGVPVYREMEYLELPNITLQVASACSGINFLIAVIAVGLPQAYLHLRGWLPRAAVIGFAVVVALLSNGLRVAIIGFLSFYELSEAVHGPGHVLQGLFVSSIGLVVVLAGVGILARRYPRAPESDARRKPRDPVHRSRRWLALVGASGLIALLIMLGVVHPELAVLHGDAAPPLTVDGWHQLPGSVPARFVSDATLQENPARVLQDPAGQHVELFIAEMARTVPDGGLRYLSVQLPRTAAASLAAIPPVAGTGVRVNGAMVTSSDRETFVYYWYDLNGRSTPHPSAAKAYASVQLLMGRQPLPRLVVASADWPAGDGRPPDFLTRFVLDVHRALSESALSRAGVQPHS